MTVDL